MRRAKEVLAPHEDEMREGLAAVGLSASRALDIVKWDIVGALTCAAYQDCRVPSDELRLLDIYEAGHVPVGLLDVYEAGHLPVGQDAARKRVLIF